MARKMGRNLKRAAAGLMACAAVALCAVSPAWAEDRAGDIVNVTVPTRIDCALGADGTVTAPGGLEVVNNGPQDLYVAASTVDDFGQKVEFAIDLGGYPLLSRAGGKDVEGEVEFAGSSRKGLGLAVSKLNRTSHAALMDAAAQGEAPMFTVGFRFTFKALQGSMSISGEAMVGETLKASIVGQQDDAKIGYRWFRDGQLINGAVNDSYTTSDDDLGAIIKCEAYDITAKYTKSISNVIGPINSPILTGELHIEGKPFEGETLTAVSTGVQPDAQLEYRWQINKTNLKDRTQSIKVPAGFENEQIVVRARDVSGKYKGLIKSAPIGPIVAKKVFGTFCQEDGSLNLYKRIEIPKQGDVFDGKSVDKLYRVYENPWGHYSPWYDDGLLIKSINVVDKCDPDYVATLFNDLKNAEFADVANLDISGHRTSPDLPLAVFYGCNSLKSLDLSSWDVTGLYNLSELFSDCYSLREINLSNWNTSSVEDMRAMFSGCWSLQNIDLSSFDTSMMGNYSRMFEYCNSLKTLDLSNFNTRPKYSTECTMEFMFYGCSSLERVTIGPDFIWSGTNCFLPSPSSSYIPGADGYWYDAATGDSYLPEEIPDGKAATYVAVNPVNAPTVTISGEAIYGSTLTARVSGQPADTTATSYQWQSSKNGKDGWVDSKLNGAQTSVLELTENNLSGSPEGFYYRCVVTTTAGNKRVPQGISEAVGPVGKIGAFAVFSADDNSLSFYNRVGKPAEGSQFNGRTATKVYADIEKTDFISASNALWADKAPVIRTIRFRDVVKPNSTKNWFANMTSLERISFANLDMSACSDMSSMFYNCTSLSSVDTADVNTASVTSMQNLFENCSKLTALDLSKFRTTSVTNMSRIFSGCSSLSDIKLTGLDVSHVEDMSYMFHNCSALTTLDVSGFRTDTAKNMHSMFFGCSNLRELDLSGFDTTNVAYMNLMFKGDIRLQSVRLGSKFAWKGSEQPYLPAPSATYIPGATGKWYSALTGAGHSPQSIPSNWADTYYASKSLAPSVTIPSSKGSVSGSDIVATINNAPGIDPTYEWHHKGNMSGSVTVAAGMSEIRESRFDVLGEVVGTVRILDSNMFRNGVFIEIENIDTNKIIWQEMFVTNSFTDVRIPRGRYIFRVRNTDPVAHEVYFAYSGSVDEVISTMPYVAVSAAEAYRPGDTIVCIVTDRKGRYPSMKSNAYTVGAGSNGDGKAMNAHVDVTESVLVGRAEVGQDMTDTSDEAAPAPDSEPVPGPEPAPDSELAPSPEPAPSLEPKPEAKPESELRPEPGSVPEPEQVLETGSKPDDLESVSVDASA